MDAYFYSCPYCGYFNDESSTICSCCNSNMIPIKSLYEYDYYKKKSFEEYGDTSKWDSYILDEVKQNPLFNEEKAKLNSAEYNFGKPKSLNNYGQKVPKCPTCGSTNISKISGINRAVHGYAFGLFSKTARSQFECKNCGYKW